MKTQQDSPVRVLALDNLHAMCAQASGTCHKYWIETVSRSRVHVGYSNPDEHGSENPMYVVLPSFPSPWPEDKKDNPRVLIEPMRVINDTWDGEGHQAFDHLWLHYANRGPHGWNVLPCDAMGAASHASLVAQHIAYHNSFDGGKRCDTCKSPDVIPRQSIEIVLELANEALTRIETEGSETLAERDAKQKAIDALDNFVETETG